MPPSFSTPMERAFDDLRLDGILVRKHFTCCSGCGTAQMAVMAHCPQCKAGLSGYVFFDIQRALLALQTGEVVLLFGTLRKQEDDAGRAVVGAAVVAALRAHGLDVAWGGDPQEVIRLTGIPQAERRIFEFSDPEDLSTARHMAALVDNAPAGSFLRHECGAGVEPCPHGVRPCPCGCCGDSAAQRFPGGAAFESPAFAGCP